MKQRELPVVITEFMHDHRQPRLKILLCPDCWWWIPGRQIRPCTGGKMRQHRLTEREAQAANRGTLSEIEVPMEPSDANPSRVAWWARLSACPLGHVGEQLQLGRCDLPSTMRCLAVLHGVVLEDRDPCRSCPEAQIWNATITSIAALPTPDQPTWCIGVKLK